MLANGAELGYKASGATEYTELSGLKEIPEIGSTPEKVENTTLKDKIKKYENGIGDPGDMVYKFKYDNTAADSPYRKFREMEASGGTYDFQETDADGTKIQFSAQVSTKRTGGGVNGVIEFDVTMALQSELEIIDPA
ncbi:MAG: phage tail protein [Eubacteriales bacterium]|nr:phage tail protein [Eubacteriales bacterium]